MGSPMDALFDRAVFRCPCCRVESTGGPPACDCFSGAVDRCPNRAARCAQHCKCADCKRNRRTGFDRVNWTGTRHFTRVGEGVTLCGRKVGALPLWRRPMLRIRDGNHMECAACRRAIVKLDPSRSPASGDTTNNEV